MRVSKVIVMFATVVGLVSGWSGCGRRFGRFPGDLTSRFNGQIGSRSPGLYPFRFPGVNDTFRVPGQFPFPPWTIPLVPTSSQAPVSTSTLSPPSVSTTSSPVSTTNAMSTTSAASEINPEDRRVFNEWRQKHQKDYKTPEEEEEALKKLVANIRKIEEHNKMYEQGLKSYKMALWEYSDLSFDEFKQRLGGLEVPDDYEESSRKKRQVRRRTRSEFSYPQFPVGPSSIDWNEKGLVGPVRQQRHCGGCYAFSAAAVMESVMRKNGIQKEASVQQIIDCSRNGRDDGCHGGFTPDAMQYIKENGITDESQYPFIGNDNEQCYYNQSMSVQGIKKVYHVPTRGNETWMRDIVGAVGPISVGICIDESIHHFHDGVYKPESCCRKVDHAPMITGYGTDPKHGDYWLVKNSWGTSFGVDGYIKFARGINLCNIAIYALYAE